MDEEYLGGTWFLILCILGALLFGWFTVGSLTAGQTPEDFMILGFVGSLAGAVLSRADRLDKDGGEAASDKSSTLRMIGCALGIVVLCWVTVMMWRKPSEPLEGWGLFWPITMAVLSVLGVFSVLLMVIGPVLPSPPTLQDFDARSSPRRLAGDVPADPGIQAGANVGGRFNRLATERLEVTVRPGLVVDEVLARACPGGVPVTMDPTGQHGRFREGTVHAGFWGMNPATLTVSVQPTASVTVPGSVLVVQTRAIEGLYNTHTCAEAIEDALLRMRDWIEPSPVVSRRMRARRDRLDAEARKVARRDAKDAARHAAD